MATTSNYNMLMDVMARLSNLMQRENELLLQPGNKEELKILLEEKKALTSNYESYIQGLNENNENQPNDPLVGQRLKDAIEKFQELSEKNATRLLAKVEATKRVFAVIQKSVQDHGNSANTYGNSGSVKNSIRQAYSPPLSVGVNDEF